MQDRNDRRSSVWITLPAWIAAITALLTIAVTLYFHHSDQQAVIRAQLLEHRRHALFNALQVIDDVYANEPFYGKPPMHPHPFNIELAREADNEMRIYCAYPATVRDFRKALGMYNPQVEPKAIPDVGALDQFRLQVARELGLPKPVALSPNEIWIEGLAGAQ